MKIFYALGLLVCLSFGTTPATAGVSIDITDVPAQSQSFFVLPFVASDTSTFVALGGYNLLSYSQATQIALTLVASDANLLELNWVLTAASTDMQYGLYADQFDDSAHGTGTNAVEFGSTVIGSYDYYSQNVTTIPGNEYILSLLFSQDYPGPNGFTALIDEPLDQTPADAGVAAPFTALQSTARSNRNFNQPNGALVPSAVPEPSTWMLMLLGFGWIGFALRSKRNAKSLEFAKCKSASF